MDNRSAFFDGQTRYFLEINGSAVKPDVLRFRGREALSEPFRWDIGFTSRNANIPPEEVLMKYASLRMRNGKNVYGIVTRLEWLSTSKDQSHYRLTLSSRLALLEHTRQYAVFQNQSVPEVVEQVLRKHGLEGADFEFRLERAYPSREIITQWQETDLQFIQRILSEVGIYWRTEMDDARGLDTYIFADSQLNYQFDVQLPYSEPSELLDDAAESVWDVRTWHNVATGTVTARDYNYRTATTPMNATVSVRNDAVTTGEHYRYAAPYREAGDDTSPEPETESGAFYARLHHERELNRSARIHLFSNAAHLSPGQVLEPQGDVITDLKEGIVLTLVTYRGARDSRLHVSAWGMPYTERYCFRPAEIPRPVIPGTLPARIESRGKNDIYAHLDGQGRYRVKMDFDREGTEPGFGYLWLRMAKPCAGETLGWHTPLIDGTEVAIAYSNGDIDLPYIAYALHDAEHPDPVNRDNHTRNILRTPANSKLRMEDRRGEEHIKLATEYGKTQLNSGHLVDSQGQLRGKGTELRTDEWGTLRAGKGLFVAADAQAKAQGGALDMDAALKEINRLNQQLQQLETAAERAQALKADIDSQRQMFEQRLKPLNEVVLFSAPEGMALTSGEDMQMSAARNVAVNAGGDISTGTMGNLTALAGERLGLFARTGQLSVKSGEGPVEVQAQNGSMRLFAEKKLTLSSASDISFAGKKRITLIGGGSYLRLEAGKVEYGTTASYMRKVKRTMMVGAATMSLNLPVMPLVDLFTFQPISQNLKPVLRLSDAPGVNGLAQSVRQWQIVEADSYMQAITTDEVLMNGQTDDAGNVFQSEMQQAQLIKLVSQYSSRLWIVVGDRAHKLYFNMIPADTSSDAKDCCAQDAMGFHRMFNSLSDNVRPGEKLKQCIQDEQQIYGAILDSLREEK
ncbi:TPA: type VI secretion system tip protein VgrG [Escherichia coli]|nr:type VI secretion system tip protein VgrG [Escherichia coli]